MTDVVYSTVDNAAPPPPVKTIDMRMESKVDWQAEADRQWVSISRRSQATLTITVTPVAVLVGLDWGAMIDPLAERRSPPGNHYRLGLALSGWS